MSLRNSILAVLSVKERTGYEITHKVDESVGFFWTATHQQIYRELAQLEQDGLVKHKNVEQDAKPNKKVYRITKTGLTSLTEWICEPTEQGPSKDALLAKLFVGHLVPAKKLLTEMNRHLEIHSTRYQKYLAIERQYFSNLEKVSAPLRFQHLTLRRGIKSEEGWIAWAKEVIQFLQQT